MKYLYKDIRQTNDKNGWVFPKDAWIQDYFVPTKLALLHSEISEALESFREKDWVNFNEELADIQIRLLDLVSGLEIPYNDFVAIIHIKNDKNKNRPFKHNKKV